MNQIFRTFQLDLKFIALPLSSFEKLEFIVKKYFVLLRNFLFGFEIGKSNIRVFGRKYYYYDKYGIAFLQSVLTEYSYLTKFISPEATIIDVGAHVGESYIFFEKILKAKKIICIEPVKESYLLLKKNISQKPYNFAVSTQDKVTIYTPDTTIMSSSFKTDKLQKGETIQGRGLDEIEEIKKLKKINLLKIDVEGSEFDVLQTAIQTLKKAGYLFIEVSLQRPASGNIFEILSLIKKVCPGSELLFASEPFIVSGVPMCIDLLIRCNLNIKR